MSRQRHRDTAPEMSLRRKLFARGLRYRVHTPLPGLPRRRGDITFARARVVVFVDGCFWHGCPEHGTIPRSNTTWWVTKLETNAARDADTNRHLAAVGWLALRFWEHESADVCARLVEKVVKARLKA